MTPLTVSRDNQDPGRLFRPEVRHVCRRVAYRNFLPDGSQSITGCLIKHLATAGFQLHKWSSSDISLVDRLPESYRETADTKHIEAEEYFIKTLGVVWKPKHDIFTYNVKPSEGSPQTKRQILSEVTRIFDPLGLLSPIVIQLRSFIQALWLDQFSWDDPLNQNLSQQYQKLRQRLKSFEEIHIPRCVLDKNTPFKEEPLQLHVICDVSITAYAATVYIRQPICQGHFRCQLLVAKIRVAPIKTICVPRLELCAALLGAQLVQSISNALEDERFPNLEVFAWTDSTVTLAWIKNHPSRWKTFVANRVAKIQRAVPGEKRNHVSTDSNPFDCASRGMSLQKPKNHQLWWLGPEWLRMPASAWPRNDIVLPKESLTEANRSHHVDENYRQTIVSNDTYNEPNSELHTVVCLPACKQHEDTTLINSTATLARNNHFAEEEEVVEEEEEEEEEPTPLKPPENN